MVFDEVLFDVAADAGNELAFGYGGGAPYAESVFWDFCPGGVGVLGGFLFEGGVAA